jgi:uncharacterized protein Yka (UPF0111/DUF47 family)
MFKYAWKIIEESMYLNYNKLCSITSAFDALVHPIENNMTHTFITPVFI